MMHARMRWTIIMAAWVAVVIAGSLSAVLAESRDDRTAILQADAEHLMANVEEMMAHGGMGDAKAIVHHCGEAARYAETLGRRMNGSDAATQQARAALAEIMRQCGRVSERGIHADPGALLNPAIKARAAARDLFKALGISRTTRG